MWILIIAAVAVVFGIVISATVLSISLNKKDGNGENYYDRQKRRLAEYNKREQENFGKLGEHYVASMLNDIAKKYKAYIYNDYTFKDNKGYSTNIDHIFICGGGIFVIETKSNKGNIYGNEEDELWYAEKKVWQNNKLFKNPVKQNQGHINHLRRMLGKNPPKVYSLIIFPVADSLHVNSNLVYDVDSAYNFIVGKINEAEYSDQFADIINGKLQKIFDEYGITLEEHKDNLRSKFD